MNRDKTVEEDVVDTIKEKTTIKIEDDKDDDLYKDDDEAFEY